MVAEPPLLLAMYLNLYPEWSFRVRFSAKILRFVARICTVQVVLRRYWPVEGGGNGQSIGYTVSDAIVCSWQESTTTGSRPLGYFSSITASG